MRARHLSRLVIAGGEQQLGVAGESDTSNRPSVRFQQLVLAAPEETCFRRPSIVAAYTVGSQRRTVQSLEPDASRSPLGAKHTSFTAPCKQEAQRKLRVVRTVWP